MEENEKEKECICMKCLYSSQPFCYFPIICVQGKRIKEFWHEIYNCKHFEPCPEPESESEQDERMIPFQVISINE